MAVGIATIVWIASKKWNKGLQAGYMFLILSITVLSRAPGKLRYELIPFWSWIAALSKGTITYNERMMLRQIGLNILMFIPIGIFSAIDIGWKSIQVAAFFSAIIESLQLVLRRGLCEVDDIIHNTLGAAIGVVIVLIINRIVGTQK